MNMLENRILFWKLKPIVSLSSGQVLKVIDRFAPVTQPPILLFNIIVIIFVLYFRRFKKYKLLKIDWIISINFHTSLFQNRDNHMAISKKPKYSLRSFNYETKTIYLIKFDYHKYILFHRNNYMPYHSYMVYNISKNLSNILLKHLEMFT